MKHRWTSLGIGALAAVVAVGCGDDDTTEEGMDTGTVSETGTDTSTDTAKDTTTEVATDTPADGTDTSTPDTAAGPSLDVQILNVSDWHGQIEPLTETVDATGTTSTYGGIALLSSYWKKDRTDNPNSITVTSGDVTGATPLLSTAATDLPDEPAILSMNFLGLQVDTLGNHNFDRGIDHYSKLIDLAKYRVLSTNLKNVEAEFEKDGKDRIKTGFHIVEVGTAPNVVKVAFLGITNPDAPVLTFPGRFGSIVIEEPSTKISTVAAEARAAGAHVVVVLIHMGSTGTDAAGKPTGPLMDVVKAITPGAVDLVLGDHTNKTVNTTINGIPVLENLSSGRNYGRSLIKVEKGKVTNVTISNVDPLGAQVQNFEILAGKTCTATTDCPTATPAWTCTASVCRRPHNCTAGTGTTACPTGYTCSSDGKSCTKSNMTPDAATDALISPWQKSRDTKFGIPVAKTAGLYLRGPTNCPAGVTCVHSSTPVYLEREFEQPLGDLLADALLAQYKSLGAEIALTNGGGIRAPIPSSSRGGVGAVTAAGSSPPTLTASGSPDNIYDVRIAVTTGGPIGTMRFKYSLDGGTSFPGTDQAAAATGAYDLPSTGVKLTFSTTGTYSTDNVYTFKTTAIRTGCSSTKPCDILLGDLFDVLPFGNKTTLRPVTAETLWQTLENSVGKKPASDGRFLQVAGFKFRWSGGATPSARVKRIELDDGTVLMDLEASTPIIADPGKECTADATCPAHFKCRQDVDSKQKCMIMVVTNDFINAGNETTPMKAGAALGQPFGDMVDDFVLYLKGKTWTPGTHNFAPPPAATARIIELP
jgi:2',3'-cyclic-nucleotide 2'-phosphodiesterase (5'-nucleotidase family)